jgi:hypothetical protein
VTLASSSIAITPGSGEIVATHTVNSKKHQVVMIADDSGHMQQTLPTYTWSVPSSVAAASKLFCDIFNAVGSGKVVEIRGIWAIPKSDVAVTGVIAVPIGLYRTNAVGTGGTAHTYNGGAAATAHVITPWDTNNPSLPVGITARAAPTAGATISALYWEQYIFTEETSPATYTGAFTNLLPVGLMNQRITLNEGQGLLIKEGPTASPVGSFSFLVIFTVTP